MIVQKTYNISRIELLEFLEDFVLIRYKKNNTFQNIFTNDHYEMIVLYNSQSERKKHYGSGVWIISINDFWIKMSNAHDSEHTGMSIKIESSHNLFYSTIPIINWIFIRTHIYPQYFTDILQEVYNSIIEKNPKWKTRAIFLNCCSEDKMSESGLYFKKNQYWGVNFNKINWNVSLDHTICKISNNQISILNKIYSKVHQKLFKNK